MNRTLDIIRDETGRPRPDLDYRDVTVSVMAMYLDINPSTLWRRVISGYYQRGIKQNGRYTMYQPRQVVGADQ